MYYLSIAVLWPNNVVTLLLNNYIIDNLPMCENIGRYLITGINDYYYSVGAIKGLMKCVEIAQI